MRVQKFIINFYVGRLPRLSIVRSMGFSIVNANYYYLQFRGNKRGHSVRNACVNVVIISTFGDFMARHSRARIENGIEVARHTHTAIGTVVNIVIDRAGGSLCMRNKQQTNDERYETGASCSVRFCKLHIFYYRAWCGERQIESERTNERARGNVNHRNVTESGRVARNTRKRSKRFNRMHACGTSATFT